MMAPISTRTPEQAGTAGNQVSAMIVTAGTDVPDARERLAAVHESTAASKAAAEATGALDLAQFSELVPGGLLALAARTASQFEMATRTTPLVNTVVSNVPGSQVPLYFAGARLVTFFGGAGVVDGMGLLHGISSYAGQLIVSVVADREMLPDPGHYADLLEQSFAELAAATNAGRRAIATASPRPDENTAGSCDSCRARPEGDPGMGDEERHRCPRPRSHPGLGRASIQRSQRELVGTSRPRTRFHTRSSTSTRPSITWNRSPAFTTAPRPAPRRWP